MRRLLSLVATLSTAGALVVLPAGAAHASALPVTALVATPGEGQVTLTWVLPVPAPAHVVVREAAGTVAPSLPTDGADVPLTSTSSAVAVGIPYATPFSFSVFTGDGVTYSGPVSITSGAVAATTVSIGVNPTPVRYGQRTQVSGRLRRAVDELPVSGEKITLYQRRSGTTRWVGWAAATTGADGTVTFPVSFGRNTQFQLVHAADPSYGGAISKQASLRVDPVISVSAPALAKSFDGVVVSGTVHPVVAGQSVYLQRYKGGWTTALATRTNSSGGYRFTLHPDSAVVYQLRVFLPSGSTHANALSAKALVTVGDRDLTSEETGGDVLVLQQRLAALHYDVGKVNGVFGFDTAHAVTAFEKVQKLPRDGVVTAAVRKALAKPLLPLLRFPVAGRSFEVDKTKQVVLMGVDGKVARILDSSTGFGGNYVYAGVTYQAITPEGSFRIQRKINGIRISHLGELYRPAYFFDGYAIHGNGSVPNRPASHGCVRITNPGMDRLYDLLTIGTPVHVYH